MSIDRIMARPINKHTNANDINELNRNLRILQEKFDLLCQYLKVDIKEQNGYTVKQKESKS